MQNNPLNRGVEETIVKSHLEKALGSGKTLRVKLGIDPTAKDLHLGHAVVLRKLKHFQDAGHKAVLIIGDFTAGVGDPSGRNELRPVLTKKEIKDNMRDYLKQAGKILDIKKTEIRYNSEWFSGLGMDFFMDMMSRFTHARVTERDDFRKRIKEGRDISLLELLYPLLQGYDSVAVKADVELGGGDQKFNLIMARKVQKRYGAKEQDIVTLPLIEGTDGRQKMSKSLGNYIGLSEKPAEMYGKVMSVPDELMEKYFLLLTDIDLPEAKELIKAGPKAAKQRLAREIVEIYHSKKAAGSAEKEFEKKFAGGKGEIKADKTLKINVAEKIKVIDEALAKSGLASSKSEARRKIREGAVELNSRKVDNPKLEIKLKKGDLIRLGKRFLRIK